MADNTIKIGGELESMATGKIVAAASAIKDKSRNKTQEAINGDVEQAIAEQSAQFEALSEETSAAVASASESARQAKQYLADLQEAITELPDGQAVSAQVAVNEVDIAGLKSDVVVDLSTRYATSYANLSAALTALNSDTAADATAIKKSGVSIKFINSTTNKYEQWNLKASSWSANASDWALDVDGSVTNGKLKLSFELEKPSSNEYVTQAECVGYGNSNVKETLNNLILESSEELTPSQSNLPGYVMPNLQFGAFGTHSIYNIEEGKFYAIKLAWPNGDLYYYTITDASDNVIFEVSIGEIFGSSTTGTATYVFKCYENASKLYVSAVGGIKTLQLFNLTPTIADIYKRLAFGNFELPNYIYKENGTIVNATSNSIIRTNITNRGYLGYTVESLSFVNLFTIDAINEAGWHYIYISDPYTVYHNDLNENGYVNCVIYDMSDNVIFAGIIKNTILCVPKKMTVLIVGTLSCVVKNNCDIESITSKIDRDNSAINHDIDELEQDIIDKTSITVTGEPLIPSQVLSEGYVSNQSVVGHQIVFGSFGNHDIYTIEANKKYKITIQDYPTGNAYYYAITDVNDIVLEAISSGDIWGENTSGIGTYTFQVHQGQAKLYVSQHQTNITCNAYVSTDLKTVVEEVLDDVDDLDNRVEALESTGPTDYFTLRDFACDGDSMLGWNTYTNNKLHFKTLSNNSQGNCKCLDRTSSTSGITKSPQWAPDCTQEDPFIDYKGLSDPNYGDGESVYKSGTEEFDQATANNCLYGHLGRFIKMVNDGVYPTPHIFIMNIMGVNDTWGTNSIDSIIGTFDNAIAGSYTQIQRDTILNSIRWFVTKFRATFPNCKLFWKTSTQQSSDRHTNFYKVEEPLLQLLRFLSVPVIDSYAEVGIMRELEHYPADNNQWTSDGTHPTAAGYQMDGEFVASKLKAWFLVYE